MKEEIKDLLRPLLRPICRIKGTVGDTWARITTASITSADVALCTGLLALA